MQQKALLFGDLRTADSIMFTPCPKEQKRPGRTVWGFNQLVWDDYSTKIVHQRSYNKFNQNPSLSNKLNATVGTTLVEVSPFDRNLRIGLRQDDSCNQRRETWLGQNNLGQILTELLSSVKI